MFCKGKIRIIAWRVICLKSCSVPAYEVTRSFHFLQVCILAHFRLSYKNHDSTYKQKLIIHSIIIQSFGSWDKSKTNCAKVIKLGKNPNWFAPIAFHSSAIVDIKYIHLKFVLLFD